MFAHIVVKSDCLDFVTSGRQWRIGKIEAEYCNAYVTRIFPLKSLCHIFQKLDRLRNVSRALVTG